MLNTKQDPAKLAIYHERLEKVFAQKWRVLMEYRASQTAREQEAEGDPASGQAEGSLLPGMKPAPALSASGIQRAEIDRTKPECY